MREIKYKVIHNPTGVDITGVCLLDSEGSVLNWKIDDYYKDSDVTVLFYTGLKDKNGVEIYEGDIVSGVLYKDHSQHIGQIKFDHNGYVIVTKEKSMMLDLTEKLLAIGNIYEHKHLLEDG